MSGTETRNQAVTASGHHRSCVCCGADRPEILYTIDDVEILMAAGSLRQTIRVSICRDCGMVFLNPIAGAETYQAYYRDHTRVTANQEGAARQEKRRRQYEYCLSVIPDYPAGGRVLDIGAHDGSLLSLFKADRWQVRGCDLSRKGRDFARVAFGIELDLADFLEAEYPAKHFDVITIFQVLEHIFEPGEVLRRARRCLKDDGVFIIEVPNLDRPSSRNLANYFNFEHVNYFELQSLTALLGAAGFEVVSSEVFAVNQSLRVAARKAPPAVIASSCYEANLRKVLDYARRYGQIIAGIERRLTPLAGKPVVLYGAGQHTEQLLREVGVAQALDTVALVDSNPDKWGQVLFGLEVKPPAWLGDRDDHAVVVSSYSFAGPITETIRTINPRLEIVELYES